MFPFNSKNILPHQMFDFIDDEDKKEEETKVE